MALSNSATEVMKAPCSAPYEELQRPAAPSWEASEVVAARFHVAARPRVVAGSNAVAPAMLTESASFDGSATCAAKTASAAMANRAAIDRAVG